MRHICMTMVEAVGSDIVLSKRGAVPLLLSLSHLLQDHRLSQERIKPDMHRS